MRDLDAIVSELRLIAAVRRAVAVDGVMPRTPPMDELLDGRLSHRGRAGEDTAVGT